MTVPLRVFISASLSLSLSLSAGSSETVSSGRASLYSVVSFYIVINSVHASRPKTVVFNTKLVSSLVCVCVQSLRAEPLSGEVHSSGSSTGTSNLASTTDGGSSGGSSSSSDKQVDGADGSFNEWGFIGGLVATIPLFCILALLWARCRYRRRVSKEEWHSELPSTVCTLNSTFQLHFLCNLYALEPEE